MSNRVEGLPKLPRGLSLAPLLLSASVALVIWFFDNERFVNAVWMMQAAGAEPPANFNGLRAAALDSAPRQLFLVLNGATLSLLTYFVIDFTKKNWQVVNKYTRELQLNVISFGADAVRFLKYRDYDGVLLNATAHDERNSPRNVLLNNTTIQLILSGIDDVDKLRAVGFECGSAFGSVIVSLSHTNREDFQSLIFVWFKYDSNAGFGAFALDGEFSPKRPIRVVLRHNFLTAGHIHRNPARSLCAFMAGYIHGVLSTFPPAALEQVGLTVDRILVTHDPTSAECTCTSRNDDKGCSFRVTSMPESQHGASHNSLQQEGDPDSQRVSA